MDEALMVDIMMKEYDTLRTEILQRIRTRFEIMGFLGVTGGLLAQAADPSRRVVLLVVGSGVLGACLSWLWFGTGIRNCAKRILVIEDCVNAMARTKLLHWEHIKETDRLEGWPAKALASFQKSFLGRWLYRR